jgi:hypothetical protein
MIWDERRERYRRHRQLLTRARYGLSFASATCGLVMGDDTVVSDVIDFRITGPARAPGSNDEPPSRTVGSRPPSRGPRGSAARKRRVADPTQMSLPGRLFPHSGPPGAKWRHCPVSRDPVKQKVSSVKSHFPGRERECNGWLYRSLLGGPGPVCISSAADYPFCTLNLGDRQYVTYEAFPG